MDECFNIDRRMAIAGLGALTLAGRAHAEKPSVTAHIVVEDQRLWVAATIAGSAPMMFVVDTGAARNYIRPDIARALKLTVIDGAAVVGVAGREATTKTVAAHDVVMGAAMRQSYMLFDTYNFGVGIPQDAAGLLAAGMFTSYDCDLDFVAGTWRVWLHGRDGTPPGVPLPGATLSQVGRGAKKIFATVQLDGKPYRMALDTGAPGSLLLFPRAAARTGLFDTRSYAPAATSGFGGAASRTSRLVRATRLEFGPLLVSRPFVTLMDPHQVVPFDHDGLIGLSLISRLDLSIDTGRGRIWAARNTRPPTVIGYKFSGLWFAQGPSGIVVETVGRGSPAEAAGIRAGDMVMGPARLDDAIALVQGEPGKSVELTIKRNVTTETKRFVLAAYL